MFYLEEMARRQELLDSYIWKRNKAPQQWSKFTKKPYYVYVMYCIHNEIEEVRNEFDWKLWKKHKFTVKDLEKLKGEIIDVWHFVLSLANELQKERKYKIEWREYPFAHISLYPFTIFNALSSLSASCYLAVTDEKHSKIYLDKVITDLTYISEQVFNNKEELLEEYKKKWAINIRRQQGKA